MPVGEKWERQGRGEEMKDVGRGEEKRRDRGG